MTKTVGILIAEVQDWPDDAEVLLDPDDLSIEAVEDFQGESRLTVRQLKAFLQAQDSQSEVKTMRIGIPAGKPSQ